METQAFLTQIIYAMATIPNIAIGLELDNSVTPSVLRLTDNTVYSPDSLTVKSYARVLQPDGIEQTFGSFAAPVIQNSGAGLNVASVAIRPDTAGQIQKGVWSVIVYVRQTGFDDTTVTIPFTVAYSRPTANITQHFNPYEPLIKAKDSTTYASGTTVVRYWDAIAANVGVVLPGAGVSYLLAINSKYYNTSYQVNFSAIIGGSIAAGVTYKDKIVKTITINPLVNMPALLNALNAKYAESVNGCSCEGTSDYVYAWTVFQNLRLRVSNCDPNTSDMWAHLQELLGITVTYDLAELEYDWMGEHCGCSDTADENTLQAPVPTVGTVATTSIQVNWLAVPGATNYVLESSATLGATYTQIYTGALLTYTETGLTHLTARYYRIKAQGTGYTESGYGALSTATADLPTLAASASLTNTDQTTTTITWEWDAIPGATNYVLEMSTNADFSGATEIYSGALLTYEKTGLTDATTYYARLKGEATGYNDSAWATDTALTDTIPPFTAHWGWQDTNSVSSLLITNAQGSGSFSEGATVVADFRSNPDPKYLYVLIPDTQLLKTNWYGTDLNQGAISIIDDSEDWRTRGSVGIGPNNYTVYMTTALDTETATVIEFRRV